MVSTAAIYLSMQNTVITLFNRAIKCESCKRKKKIGDKWTGSGNYSSHLCPNLCCAHKLHV